MPIERTPNNLYAGHAVVFDAMPYVRYADQVQARKQAKDNALDSYFQKLPSTINPAGMRNVDVPDFVSKTNDLRDFYNKNKDAIKNPRIDNGRAQTEYFSRVEDGKLYVQRSKQTEEMKKPLVAILADPNKRQRIRPNTFEAIAKHDLPLNGGHVPIDFNSDLFAPKPHEADKYFRSFADIKMTEDITTTNDPKNPLKDIATTKFYFDKKAIAAIAERARDKYNNDPGFAEYVEEELSKPEEYAALNEQFKKHMGRNIDISHPEELAIAYTLTGKQLEYEKEKLVTDQNAAMDKRFGQQKTMEGIRQGNRERLLGLRQAAAQQGKEVDGRWVDDYIGELIGEAKSSGKTNTYISNGVKTDEYLIPIDAVIGKALAREGGIQPDVLTVSKDGKTVRPIFYHRFPKGHKLAGQLQEDENGVAVDKLWSVPIATKQLKLTLGKTVGVKQTNVEMNTTPEQPSQTRESKLAPGFWNNK